MIFNMSLFLFSLKLSVTWRGIYLEHVTNYSAYYFLHFAFLLLQPYLCIQSRCPGAGYVTIEAEVFQV